MKILEFHARADCLDGGLLDGEDQLVEVALRAAKPRRYGEGAGDVGGVAVHLGGRIHEHEVAIVERAGGG